MSKNTECHHIDKNKCKLLNDSNCQDCSSSKTTEEFKEAELVASEKLAKRIHKPILQRYQRIKR